MRRQAQASRDTNENDASGVHNRNACGGPAASAPRRRSHARGSRRRRRRPSHVAAAPCKTFAAPSARRSSARSTARSRPLWRGDDHQVVTIDCRGRRRLASGNGIIINITPGNPNGPGRQSCATSTSTGAARPGPSARTGINSIRILNAQIVYLEDLMTGIPQRGISDERTTDSRSMSSTPCPTTPRRHRRVAWPQVRHGWHRRGDG